MCCKSCFFRLILALTDNICSADDRSTRYVAEENIELATTRPSKSILHLAGRYFKRWDQASGAFISNILEEFPDD